MKAIFDPEEIALKKFVIRWRGYDTREVETFLRAVAVDFRRLIDRVARPTSRRPTRRTPTRGRDRDARPRFGLS